MRSATVPLGPHANHFYALPYEISSEVAKELVPLFNRVHRLKKDSPLGLPTARLSDARSPRRLDESLIDLWIALESIFLPDDHAREMAQLVARSAAYYLGENERERRAIETKVSHSHHFRSALEHGRKHPDDKALTQAVIETDDLVCRAIRRRLFET